MIHFRTKNNLIEWLIKNCPRPAIVRALLKNGAECLGGFSRIPPSTQSGWIVRVTSAFNKKWIVAVLAHDSYVKYGIRILKDVPWEYWIGYKSLSDLYIGDNPLLYKQLCVIKKRKIK